VTLSQKDAMALVRDRLHPLFNQEKDRLDRIDKWMRWEHDAPHQPRQATREYRELSVRAQAPWLNLIVTSVAQNLYVDGYRPENSTDNAEPWDWWQVNGLDARQIAVHRAALGYGLSYVTVLPGEDDSGQAAPAIRGHSPRRMMAFYAEPEFDDWPLFALRVAPRFTKAGAKGLDIRLYDDEAVYFMQADNAGVLAEQGAWDVRTHDVGRCPVVRFANQLDLEGRTPGEVEPLIPIAGRIDQTVFDRLVVQRFASWVVRTIAGMSQPEDATPEQVAAEKLRLRVEDILVAEDADTKFGSLPATQLDGFIKAVEADIHALAAISQTPVYELLGDLINLSADALEAARASFGAKIEERKQTFGESWEQVFRLAGAVMGNEQAAQDFSSQAWWRDTSIRSLAQAADALGKMAKMLGVPVELLWERIPGFTQQDVERAKTIVQEGGSLAALTALLERQTSEPGEPAAV
jgi:hypothetical protein